MRAFLFHNGAERFGVGHVDDVGAMGDVLDRILEYAADREAIIAALGDLDDAVAARMEARMRGEVQA